MKRLAILLPLMIVLSLSCKKTIKKFENDTTPGPDEKVKIIPGGGGNLSSGGAGGGQGAAQSVRNAAARSVNDQLLADLRLSIETLRTANTDGKAPSANEIKDEIRQNGKLAALIKDEVVILTNTEKGDGIWAYTKWPQRGGKHFVVTAAGRVEMTPAELTKALKDQGSDVKLEK